MRNFHPGMGQAVAERTILRKFKDGSWETWEDVAKRVASGNASLVSDPYGAERINLEHHLSNATLLMSGRHLQHSDATQPFRTMEVFTNCATSATSFMLFYLLMSGSGVGRSYDDDLMVVNWDNAPNLRCVLAHTHPDFDWSAHESVDDARHKYHGKDLMWFQVPDTREGWAEAVEIYETAAFERIHKDKLLVLDFSLVRAKGTPILGMQNRPASGPVPLMNAMMKVATIKGSGLAPWRQAMYVDHHLAECVLIGGARRSARMSTKFWKDEDILEFITIKKPLSPGASSFLWSSNNSVMVDEAFWEGVQNSSAEATLVFNAIIETSYGTGEPGIINVNRLKQDNSGLRDYAAKGEWLGSSRYTVREETELLLKRLAKRVLGKRFNMLTNPCGEINLMALGGFCVLCDVVPYHATSLDEAEEAFRTATRALIRVNTMDSVYHHEVRRTNRIGVGMTGIHEFMWKFFQLGFREALDNSSPKALLFWETISRFRDAVIEEGIAYSKALGLNTPHTMLTLKPAGTTSKLFGLTEGGHLPSMEQYIRWVQFSMSDPLVEQYQAAGYPSMEIRHPKNTVIIGFPTTTELGRLGLNGQLVCAAEATPEEQYRWLQLLEKHWLGDAYGSQLSYTLKYDPAVVSKEEYAAMLLKYQPTIKCCSVMPQTDTSAYEYQPEQAVTKAEYEVIAHQIKTMQEDVDKVHVDCASGACPIDFRSRE